MTHIKQKIEEINRKLDFLINRLGQSNEFWIKLKIKDDPISVFRTEQEAIDYLESEKISSGKRFSKIGELRDFKIDEIEIVARPFGLSELRSNLNWIAYQNM